MTRNQYNLYINNISDLTTEDCLISFLSQFGKIVSHTFFRRTLQRKSAAAIITYDLSVDINKLIENYQRIKLNGHNLYLRRTLPMVRPAYERFMSSNQLIVSLKNCLNDQQFNETFIRKYFSKYGSIISCRIIIINTTYLIDYAETNCVDTAILDEPHFYNEYELILRKYVSPRRIGYFRSKKILFNQENPNIKFSMLERIRRLKHINEAFQFAYKIELKLIKYSYAEKIFKLNSFNQLNKENEELRKKNKSLMLMIEQKKEVGQNMKNSYKTNIENRQNRIKELKQAIQLLTDF